MNWPLEQFNEKSVVFVGVGQGRSMEAFKSFIENHGNIRSFEGVDKGTGEQPLGFLQNYDQEHTVFVKNEGIPGHEMPVPYITPMNVFFACAKKICARTIGITGTKGKSTTSALTAEMLKAGGLDVRLAGNIGNSVFNEIETATKDTVFVLELSSYQLSDIEYSPDVAACINLYNDHADWHGTKENYWEAKHKIIAHSAPDDLFIYNPDFPVLADWAKAAKCRTRPVDTHEEIGMQKSELYGEHNRLNALVARMVARNLGVEDSISQAALDKFKPLEHRMEFVATKQGHTFINDAIGMTPESTLASMKAVVEKHGSIGCLLLGGQDRGYDFTELLSTIAAANIPNLVLFPDTSDTIKASLPSGYAPAIYETNDMTKAVNWASENTPKDSIVLLSTAAPSYSVWKGGFEEKGTLFKQAVLKI